MFVIQTIDMSTGISGQKHHRMQSSPTGKARLDGFGTPAKI
ncbi:hypothetical protein RLEG12_02125 (plasmid) [Rhizobium leguminosarum bv. trifolii CB782]|nr:hypothetical protein RLEG12_02125 [Rhizobium leguminosarum bv. trifolii CB782]